MARQRKVIRKTIRIGGKPHTMRFGTKAQADLWYSQMRTKKENARAGVEMPIQPMTFTDAAANLLVDKQGQSNFGHDKYRLETYLIPVFGERHIHTIVRQEWKTFFKRLETENHLAPKTINNIRTLANLIYKEAMKNDPPNVRKNPITDTDPVQIVQKEMPHWKSTHEIQAYLEGAAREHTAFWIFAMLALNTGMREGEIIALKWRDVDFKTGTIFIWQTWDTRKRVVKGHTKTKVERTIGINETLAAALIAHRGRTAFKSEDDHIVYRWKTGNVTDSKTLWEVHSRVIEKAGIKYINIHGLRHTFATQYLAHGGNLYDLKNILGHKSITMTEKYAHLVPQKIHARAAVFQIGNTAGDDEMMTLENFNEQNTIKSMH